MTPPITQSTEVQNTEGAAGVEVQAADAGPVGEEELQRRQVVPLGHPVELLGGDGDALLRQDQDQHPGFERAVGPQRSVRGGDERLVHVRSPWWVGRSVAWGQDHGSSGSSARFLRVGSYLRNFWTIA